MVDDAKFNTHDREEGSAPILRDVYKETGFRDNMLSYQWFCCFVNPDNLDRVFSIF